MFALNGTKLSIFSFCEKKICTFHKKIPNNSLSLHPKQDFTIDMNKEFIVLSRQDAVARNNSPYVNLKVANNEGVENICVFDVPKTSGPKVGQLVRFLTIRENQGKKSATNMDMIAGTFPTENHPLYNMVPRPVSIAMERFILSTAGLSLQR